MAILQIHQEQTGRVGINPQKLLINTDNTVAEVTTAGYLTKYGSVSNVQFSDYQLAEVYTTDGKVGVYQVSVDTAGIASLVANTDGIVITPVVSGNFPKFSGTTGVMVDSGISPSNAAKTKAVMADAATTANTIPKFTDTAGTIGNGYTPSNTAKTVAVMADAATTSGRIAAFTDTAGTVGNGPVAANVVLTSAITTPDVGPNLVTFDVTVGQAALAAGVVTLYASSGAKQYKVRALWVNGGGTNFSGGGGNRLLDITDGATVYSTIPAASLQTLENTGWGETGLPYPVVGAINTSTSAGAALTATYSGGTTDYTAGSVVISGILERVA